MSKFFVYTFGCRCNQADSAAIREGLCRSSMREAENSLDAELVVINTCTVTQRTDRQIRQMVRRVHRENPHARMAVTGCYAERDPLALAAIPGVSLVIGNADKDRLAALVSEESPQTPGKVIRSRFDAGRDYLIPPMFRLGGRTRPFLKIQDGCDARCSYCIVPTVRGPGRSAKPEDILAEVGRLIRLGYQEIVVTGVHLGTYGNKLSRRTGLVELLKRILETPGLGRLRLSSIEPMSFSQGIVDLASTYRNFAPHFHIPMQSGSDRILRKMRRPYTALRFLELLEHIRAKLPAAGLGTDVIAGFPGETDRDFEKTCELIRDSPLTYVHVFPFSAREGTDAYEMTDRVADPVIYERARMLRALSHEKDFAFRRSLLGRVLPAISLSKEEEAGEFVALTDNYIPVCMPRMPVPPNRLIEIQVREVERDATYGAFASETNLMAQNETTDEH